MNPGGRLAAYCRSVLVRLRNSGDRREVIRDGHAVRVVRNGAVVAAFTDGEVDSICAISRDRLTTDEIFLVFRCGSRHIAVSEFDRGFAALADGLGAAFPLRHTDWLARLNRGAPFLEHDLLLYER